MNLIANIVNRIRDAFTAPPAKVRSIKEELEAFGQVEPPPPTPACRLYEFYPGGPAHFHTVDDEIVAYARSRCPHLPPVFGDD